MKIKTFKINVLLEFESVQPSTVEESYLKEAITDVMKNTVPEGCKIADVRVKQISEEEKTETQILEELKQEIAQYKEQERKNMVDDIMVKRYKKSYGSDGETKKA